MKTVSFFVILFLVHFGAFWIIKSQNLMIDEYHHYNQIASFWQGSWAPTKGISMLPTYHAVLGSLALFARTRSLEMLRFISFAVSFVSIIVFYWIAFRIDAPSARVRTVQYALFPLFFPFFPILYTDIFTLTFVLATMLAVLARKPVFTITGAVVMLFLRQNTIVWVLFAHALRLTVYAGSKKKVSRHNLLHDSIDFLPAYVFFLLFLVVNRGFAVGIQTYQPVSFFNMGNIYLLLSVFFILFLPVIAAGAKRLLLLLKKPWIWLLVAAGLGFFLLTFANTHPWNQSWYFLHNMIPLWASQSLANKLVYFVAIAVGVLALTRIRFVRKEFLLLYPFTVLSLLPFWFVEARYLFVPFALFLLFRKAEKPWVEYIQTGYFILLAGIVFWGVSNWRFFL